MVVNSYAKLNLYLEVLSRRRDNYHNIRTLFERIDLHDTLIFRPRQDKSIRIICKNPEVPRNSSNLCFCGAKLLQQDFSVEKGVDIEIIKRIPVGAGLGGGSSNAAAALQGLNKIWKLGLNTKKLTGYAKRIGADVAFFLYDCRFAIANGIGEEIKTLNLQRVKRLWHVLAMPSLSVSTAAIYKGWDKLDKLELTKPAYDVKILNSALRNRDFSLLGKCLFNSLEQVTGKLHPEVGLIRKKLFGAGLKAILMSGSGPAVFGVVSSRKEAVFHTRELRKEGRKWQVFATSTF